jgi:hypothetical protein
MQKYIFIFEKDGKKYETPHVTQFCKRHNLNPTSIRVYIKSGALYKGWKVDRRLFTEKETELYEKGIDYSLWYLNNDSK